jgi:hypothetical protein
LRRSYQYQRTPSLPGINAAHNHYLQVAAEGLLLGIPVAGDRLFSGIRTARRATSPMYFARAR